MTSLQYCKVRKLSEEDKCYLAGFLDGEGTFSIYRIKNRRTPTLRPHICVANTNEEIIDWVKKTIGAGCLSKGRAKKKKNWKPYLTLDIYRFADIAGLIKQLLPFLKVKRKQAELLLEFCESRLRSLCGVRHNQAPYAKREYKIVDEVQQLNKKGSGDL